jgi:hypothetical protein
MLDFASALPLASEKYTDGVDMKATRFACVSTSCRPREQTEPHACA